MVAPSYGTQLLVAPSYGTQLLVALRSDILREPVHLEFPGFFNKHMIGLNGREQLTLSHRQGWVDGASICFALGENLHNPIYPLLLRLFSVPTKLPPPQHFLKEGSAEVSVAKSRRNADLRQANDRKGSIQPDIERACGNPLPI